MDHGTYSSALSTSAPMITMVIWVSIMMCHYAHYGWYYNISHYSCYDVPVDTTASTLTTVCVIVLPVFGMVSHATYSVLLTDTC